MYLRSEVGANLNEGFEIAAYIPLILISPNLDSTYLSTST